MTPEEKIFGVKFVVVIFLFFFGLYWMVRPGEEQARIIKSFADAPIIKICNGRYIKKVDGEYYMGAGDNIRHIYIASRPEELC